MDMKLHTNAGIPQEPALRAEEVRPSAQAAASAGGSGETAAAPARRPACDRYIPQKPEDTASYGHYQPVSDGEGNTRIQFDAPSQEPGADREDRASTPAETPAAAGSRQNAQVLEMRKKRLEQQVRSAGNSEQRKSLKQKLEQIKRALKAARG